MTRPVAREILAASAVIVLGTVAGLDAMRDIPPVADDYWLLVTPPVDAVATLVREFGPMARPLGVWVLGALAAGVQYSGIAVPVLVIAWRVLTLALTYFVIRRALGLPATTALLALSLFLLTPPACEAWTLLCTSHQALSAPVALAACALFARSTRQRGDALLVSLLCAAGMQLVAFALYEQALLMVPAFALVCALFVLRRREFRTSALASVATAGFVTGAWAVAIFVTGYAARRGVGAGGASAAEASDFLGAAASLWVGFLRHHVWRLAEYVRTGVWFPWDPTTAGVIAACAAGALAVYIGLRLSRVRAENPSSNREVNEARCELSPGVHVVAAYAALLPIGLAFPGFASFSRMYYLPGLSLAIAAALVISRLARRAPRWTSGIGVIALLWIALVWRDYLSDLRLGSQMLRSVASATLGVPQLAWGEGVLIIAPDVVGTFSSAAVQSWTVRPAMERLWHRSPAGPLFFASDCGEAVKEQKIRDESNAITRGRDWGRVIAARGTEVVVAADVRQACINPRHATSPVGGMPVAMQPPS